MKVLYIHDYRVLIGENKTDNWSLLDNRDERHLFFHLTSFPSCYIILECLEPVSNKIKMKCAEICREHTKYKRLKNLKVDCCECSNLRKGEKIGEVEYKSNRKVEIIKI